MKATSITASAFLSGLLLFSGCGKSEADKKAEAELNDKIMKAHEQQMSQSTQVDQLLAKIDAVIAEHDSLAKLFPKQMADNSTADLLTAKDKLSAAKDGMESWMSAHEPYNPGIKHDLAMQQLTNDLDVVNQVGEQLAGAISAATTALDSHAKFVADLTAATHKGKRK